MYTKRVATSYKNEKTRILCYIFLLVPLWYYYIHGELWSKYLTGFPFRSGLYYSMFDAYILYSIVYIIYLILKQYITHL